MALCEHLIDIGVEDRRIQMITFERAPQEEGTATAKNATDNRHVQINAGGNMRQMQPILIGDVAQQQVVNVATMTRDVNDFLFFRNVVQALHVIDLNTVIYSIPEPSQ